MENIAVVLLKSWEFFVIVLAFLYRQILSSLSDFLFLFTSDYWKVPYRGSLLASEWKTVVIILCILYPPAVFFGQRYMKNRAPLKLKFTAVFWNLFLSFSSLYGSFLILRYDFPILLQRFYMEENYIPSTRAVIALFTLTKVLEFGDTAILVAKKKPILFLHIYHHFTVTLYCLHAQAVNVAFGHHFAFINLCIHSVMYLYYALTVIAPRWWFLRVFRPYITISQTMQMVIGCGLAYSAICASNLPASHGLNARLAFAMYISYAILFGKLYMENYRKQYRPFLTLFVGTIHLLALVGAWIVWQHAHHVRLLTEVLGGYCLTALLFWLTRDTIPFTSGEKIYANLQDPSTVAASARESKAISASPIQDETLSKERKNWKIKLQTVSQFGFLILNCIAAWLKDHMVVKIKNELKCDATTTIPASSITESIAQSLSDLKLQNAIGTLSTVSIEGGTSNLPVGNSCPSIDSNSTQTSPRHRIIALPTISSSSSSPSGMEVKTNSLDFQIKKATQKQKKPKISCLREFLKKVDDSINPSGRSSTSFVSNLGKKSTFLQALSSRKIKDTWLMVACLITPAIYGKNIYGDFFLGICVHGALRWVLELHTTNTFLKDIYAVASTAIKDA